MLVETREFQGLPVGVKLVGPTSTHQPGPSRHQPANAGTGRDQPAHNGTNGHRPRPNEANRRQPAPPNHVRIPYNSWVFQPTMSESHIIHGCFSQPCQNSISFTSMSVNHVRIPYYLQVFQPTCRNSILFIGASPNHVRIPYCL